ncbi:MAG: Ig-like domain-containing protein [Pseudomonadota bacterium]
MHKVSAKKMLPHLAILLALSASHVVVASEVDHREFEATLHVPFKADAAAKKTEARVFTLNFEYPYVEQAQDISWRLELVSPSGQVVEKWQGVQRLFKKSVEVKIRWAGRPDSITMPDGLYQVRMQAVANNAPAAGAGDSSDAGIDKSFAAGGEVIEQSWELAMGNVAAPAMPPFATLKTARPAPQEGYSIQASAPATGALPYTVYFANLHSQTNHSDGGGAVSSCSGSQQPLAAPFGPSDAFIYAKNRGLDILVASEHNHMYDGSSSTNTSATPAAAKALYQSGLTAASDFNAANPNFLGVYGMEWGVISNGGHLNIFNSNELLAWEYNASGQLLGDTLTEKTDYASLYTLMRQRGWVGQFNHPATSGQFLVNGVPLGYTADGDQAMVLCEIMNTSAFSVNTTETETGRSVYEGACQKALESGFHIAFATNQDNHCANWGASYTNRTGILIPNGTPLTQASFVEALKARRVFATMDKNSQLVLTGNGQVMGSRISNSGPLNLVANFASTTGQTVSSVAIIEGIPGRNGAASTLATVANHSFTPSVGEHYYYAKVTQADGKILWSAPIWVSQTANTGDTVQPTVSASASGSSGNITVAATASDNVGVTLVEFYVDGVLKASSNVAPYSAVINSTTLSNGSHSLSARAYDAAGNVGVSSAVGFSVNNTTPDTVAPTVSATQSGASGTITLGANASDNVGVSKVEFYVDGVLKGSDTAAPYSMTLNSTTLTNGSHALTAKAFDAANNSTTSAPVTFSISNTTADTVAPTVSASASGTSGTITLNATASDNVGVSKVEFYVDGLLKGSDTSAPYSLAIASSTLSSGSHTLTAKAFDAANNSTTSAPASFSVTTASQQIMLNTGFESGAASWSATSGVITNDASQAARSGTWKAWLNGYGTAHTDSVYQSVAIPAGVTSATLKFWLKVSSAETTTTSAYDTLKVQVRSSSGAVLATLATYSNLNKGTTFLEKSFSLAAYKGQTVRIYFEGIEGSTVATSFIVDDVTLTTQ